MTPPPSSTPEQKARIQIDAGLEQAGWKVQDRDEINLSAGQGVAVREFKLDKGHGYADYLLIVDGKAVGVLEAKPAGHTLTGVEFQAQKYSEGLPSTLNAPITPLPFLYISTGIETLFSNLLDPDPKSRRISQVHRPSSIAEWLKAETLDTWVKRLHAEGSGLYTAADDTKPSTLRARLTTMPELATAGLFPNQIQAVLNLERSLRADRPRSLIQMATGSGKTIFAVTALYRLIKFGGARRVLFLVDRTNLGEQAEKAFNGYRTPDDNRFFSELYNVQHLTSNTVGSSSKVVITTIQRFFSMLKGEPAYDSEAEEASLFETTGGGLSEPLPVAYNPTYPPEFFDVVVVDECHRSIYTLWRQVLEYFDAFLIGLTATPAKHTFGFFNQNLVMEYPHERAVADGVNVDFEVYEIRTKITQQGSTIETRDAPLLPKRDRNTREIRWEKPDEDVVYEGKDLDRSVVAKDQIRLIVRTFRDRLFTEIFPGRKEVPKTLIFAKDDSHADDIVGIVREEFGRGNAFCQKITYKTTGKKPKDLIQEFRNSYDPRIAVTVDMIATGTDVRPIEIVMFMRTVKSRVLFEQMKGRGVRIIGADELKAVTPDADAKTHFVIVDCVGMVDSPLSDTQPLDRKKAASFKSLLEHVALGGTDADTLSSLASRLTRLEKKFSPEHEKRVADASHGVSLKAISQAIVGALDGDRQVEEARRQNDLGPDQEPTKEQLDTATESLLKTAAAPLATNPKLRKLILEIKQEFEQVIDEISKDELLSAGTSEEAREKARSLVGSFEQYIEDNKDEITALQFFYSQPHATRLRFEDIKKLVEAIQAPPRSWTPERLWRAYQLLDKDKVRGASAQRLLTDVVSLVRYALHRDAELVPYVEQVRERFENWMAQQKNAGKTFTQEQERWLTLIRDHIANSLEIQPDDFDYTPFAEEGGLGAARKVFGDELREILGNLNEALAA